MHSCHCWSIHWACWQRLVWEVAEAGTLEQCSCHVVKLVWVCFIVVKLVWVCFIVVKLVWVCFVSLLLNWCGCVSLLSGWCGFHCRQAVVFQLLFVSFMFVSICSSQLLVDLFNTELFWKGTSKDWETEIPGGWGGGGGRIILHAVQADSTRMSLH